MGKAMLGLLAGLAEEELDARRRGWDEAHLQARRARRRERLRRSAIGKVPDGRLRYRQGGGPGRGSMLSGMRADGASLANDRAADRPFTRDRSRHLGEHLFTYGTIRYGASP